ncbi:apolipoprotein N-acyltransferase [Gulosibacter macacae]|uniref:Apolipoprotein N-acyltransferase n=1 Tax=Gulosibacter macacae TaxID=2488791 RepID=A0A3P3VWJ6_9MICO|nr:apolipoprotein N-acyltransferase [Gulosibacter macacae]RRJ87165.1 apolipoprotein N-acyltransferase [Gulosibacter macacae]
MTEAPPRALDWPAAMAATLAGALLLAAAFPGLGLWPLAPVGVAFILLGMRGRRPTGAAGLGFIGGLAFYLGHVQWTSEFLGAVPWLALSTLMALWWAAGHALIAACYRRVTTGLGWLPVAVASVWSLRELLSSTVPYGGFAWGRVAQSQSAAPWVDLVSWVGLSGLSFALVWLAAFALELVLRPGLRAAWLPRATALGLTITALIAWPLWPTQSTGTVRILAVQGDTPGASYFIPSEPGEIVLAHEAVTRTVDAGEQLDLILWPEGSVDVSPVYSPVVADLFTALTRDYQAPLLANTVTVIGEWGEPGTEYFNSQFVWTTEGGFGEQYDKAHPVPFGEYVPDRDFFMSLAPDLVGMIGREYTPGARPNVLEIDGVRYGVFICYDIVDDRLVREAVAGGAQVLLAPTNNADFARTDESAQQLATARLRAVETGRALVQASTVGWSAAYGPDGAELAALEWYEPGAFVVEVPLASGTTPAAAFGEVIERVLAGLGLAILLAGRGRTSRASVRAQ